MSTAPRLAAANRDWGHDETNCTVLHIDMDAFYASLEIARHPELANKPVIIGTGARSVVSAANYEARKYGINSAMASARAQRLCPNGVFLPVDIAYYRSVSEQIFHTIFSQITDAIEQVSVDECYMDVSGALLTWGSPTRIAAWIRHQVEAQFHITCSVGIAANKLVAKMASTNAKPNGMLLIPASEHAAFVQMMPLRAIPGIGPSQERKLQAWGVSSVRELAALSVEDLERITKSHTTAQHLFDAARGRSSRVVTPHTPEKSIGSEHTLQEDTANVQEILSLLHHSCATVARTLRARGLLGRTVSVKLRFPDLHYMTRSVTIDQPTDTTSVIFATCEQVFRSMMGLSAHDTTTHTPIRLAGVSMSNLSEQEHTAIQPTLDDLLEESTTSSGNTATQRMRGAERALDAVQAKFGKGSARLGL